MRRKDKEIKDHHQLEDILKHGTICRLAFVDNDTSYIVPLSYGYTHQTLYFHSAAEGKKIDLLRKNPRLCFEIETGVEVVSAPLPCNWGMKYKTIIGHGTATIIENISEKMMAMNIIMDQYGLEHPDRNIKADALKGIVIFKLSITKMTGKVSGY